ncbi:MAG: CPBP family intramembrane metalloprotease, partial [Oscillospiraceae bacterium]|nr:CPBP family intramembrane metalloprotease [Oscillospiraceae bacterium]
AFVLYAVVSAIPMLVASVICNFNLGFPDMINATMSSSSGNGLQSALTIAMIIGIVAFAVKKGFTTRDSLGLDESPKRAVAKLVLGFLAGALIISAEIGLLCMIEKIQVTVFSHGAQAVAAVLFGVVIYASVGLSEELLFRGYIQGLFGERKVLGIVVTAALFAVMHLLNSSYSAVSLIYLIAGGLLFSLLREVTKSLWLPIGLHVAWDWVEISIFGLNVDGEKHWLSVKADELTESILCAAIMAVFCAVLVVVYIIQRKRSEK